MHASFSIRYTDLESHEEKKRNSASRDDIITIAHVANGVIRDMTGIKVSRSDHTGYLATANIPTAVRFFDQFGINFPSTKNFIFVALKIWRPS